MRYDALDADFWDKRLSAVALERGRAYAAVIGDDIARRIEWVRADLLRSNRRGRS